MIIPAAYLFHFFLVTIAFWFYGVSVDVDLFMIFLLSFFFLSRPRCITHYDIIFFLYFTSLCFVLLSIMILEVYHLIISNHSSLTNITSIRRYELHDDIV